jgi:hypothetical protein
MLNILKKITIFEMIYQNKATIPKNMPKLKKSNLLHNLGSTPAFLEVKIYGFLSQVIQIEGKV